MRFYVWILLLIAVGGSFPIGLWRIEEVSPSSAMVRRDFLGTQTMGDAAKMALDGLEMGYRVIGSRLKEVMHKSKRKIDWECDRMKEGDSMRVAKGLLNDSLWQLPKARFPIDKIGWLQPWSLGYLNGTLNQIVYVELGGDPDYLERSLAFLERQSADWYADQWRELIIAPVEKHHDEWVRWIKASATVGTFNDETQEAIERCRTWLNTHLDRGGPTEKEKWVLEALIEANGKAESSDIGTKAGLDWAIPVKSMQGYRDRIGEKLKNEPWEIGRAGSEFLIRLKR